MPIVLSAKELHEYVRTSNAIEGVYAGQGDTLYFGQHLDTVLRVMNTPTLLHVREIHALLMQNLLEYGEVAGQYRTLSAYIGSRALPLPAAIPQLMMQYEGTLQEFFTLVKTENFPESGLVAALTMLHDEGLCIHPFPDGNGRTFRLALNHWRQLCGLSWIIFTPNVWQDYLVRLRQYEQEVFRGQHDWVYEPGV